MGALIVVVCDDPGMHSSQNEQDSRRYAVAAGAPMLEPADSQEAYDFFCEAITLSERWGIPVLLRLTTRVSHSKSIVQFHDLPPAAKPPYFEHNRTARVMVPSNARPAHRRLRQHLDEIAQWGETCSLHQLLAGKSELGIISSSIAAIHAREAAPEARLLKLGLIHPFPIERMRKFAAGVNRCVVIEEGDPVLTEACLAAGIPVQGKADMYRFGELNVGRVRRILAGDTSPEPVPPRGKPPELCQGCPHRSVFETLHNLDCIVSGDIGCYTLGVMPPFEAMDSCVCMGASIGVGLGLRHVLPPDQAKRVVSVIGDSTFVHSGITGLVEMVYNPPPTGHVLLILDNNTTAMTGLQEHPGTGRTLDHKPTGQVVFEDLARSLGVEDIQVVDAQADRNAFEELLKKTLDAGKVSVIIARKPCILAAVQAKKRAAVEAQKSGAGSQGSQGTTPS
jgi:indolepyruvate ferredoxin oxidoreductase alpha subunit